MQIQEHILLKYDVTKFVSELRTLNPGFVLFAGLGDSFAKRCDISRKNLVHYTCYLPREEERCRFQDSHMRTLAPDLVQVNPVRSQAFKKSNGGGCEGENSSYIAAGGLNKIENLLVERPTLALFNAVIIEPVPPEH